MEVVSVVSVVPSSSSLGFGGPRAAARPHASSFVAPLAPGSAKLVFGVVGAPMGACEPGAEVAAPRFESAPKTAVEIAACRSPLKLLMPRNHGLGAWVFASNYGGGLLEGDALSFAIEVKAGATALLGTQATTKIYRAAGLGSATQRLDAKVGQGGCLALLPDPVMPFAGARYEQTARVELAAGASLLSVECFVSGRVARGERWAFERLASAVRVFVDGAPRFVDGLVLDQSHGDVGARMGRFDAIATVIAFGPAFAPLRRALLEAPKLLGKRADALRIATPLRPLQGGDGAPSDAVVVRYASTSAERLATRLRHELGPVRNVLGDDPFARKF